MVVAFPQISLDVYVAFSMVLATTWLYIVFTATSTTKTSKILSSLLLLHTLYLLHSLLVSPPPNIFKSLRLPVNIPSEYLWARLLEVYGGEQNIPTHLASLPKRLGLMELRSIYVRFGHEVITSCSYCQSSDDYALYAIPAPFLEYICEIAFVGILTLPRTLSWSLRPLGLGALLASALTEIYWVLSVRVIIPPFGEDTPIIMWHDTFVQLRRTLFLILPLLIAILPHIGLHRIPVLGSLLPALFPSPSEHKGKELIPADITLNQITTMTLQTLGHLLPTLHLLKYTHAAVMRSQDDRPSSTASDGSGGEGTPSRSTPAPPESSPHALATQWWADEAREGRLICTDNNVREVLKLDGLGSDDVSKETGLPQGQLLLSAKMAVKMLKEQGARPSEHWVGNSDMS